jgi:hypothetical protein
MFNTELASRIDGKLDALLTAQIDAGKQFESLKKTVQIWLGNGQEGLVQASLKTLDQGVKELAKQRVDCARDCDTKIAAVREVALHPSGFDDLVQQVHDHEIFIVEKQTEVKKVSGISSSIREWGILIAAGIAIIISVLSLLATSKPTRQWADQPPTKTLTGNQVRAQE